jgi:hypothetical protein
VSCARASWRMATATSRRKDRAPSDGSRPTHREDLRQGRVDRPIPRDLRLGGLLLAVASRMRSRSSAHGPGRLPRRLTQLGRRGQRGYQGAVRLPDTSAGGRRGRHRAHTDLAMAALAARRRRRVGAVPRGGHAGRRRDGRPPVGAARVRPVRSRPESRRRNMSPCSDAGAPKSGQLAALREIPARALRMWTTAEPRRARANAGRSGNSR